MSSTKKSRSQRREEERLEFRGRNDIGLEDEKVSDIYIDNEQAGSLLKLHDSCWHLGTLYFPATPTDLRQIARKLDKLNSEEEKSGD